MVIDYTLIRSNRTTAALCIRDGGLIVRAPRRMPKREIDRFVISKEKWITSKLALSKERTERRESFRLDYGCEVTYRGSQYTIEAKAGNRVGFDGKRFYIPPGLAPETIKAACVKIYRMLAKNVLTEKTLAFARLMSAGPAGAVKITGAPGAIRITGARTRWGSCSAKKNINFSWRLIMAGDDVIDYVVVHELAHLAEMNHSKRFWGIVGGVLPDYARRRARLRELQRKLAYEDWD